MEYGIGAADEEVPMERPLGNSFKQSVFVPTFITALVLIGLLGWGRAETMPAPRPKRTTTNVVVTVDVTNGEIEYTMTPTTAARRNQGDILVNNGDKIQWKAVSPGGSNEIVVFVPDHVMGKTTYSASDGAKTPAGTVSGRANSQHKYSVQLYDKQSGNYYHSPDPQIIIGSGGVE